MNPKNIAIIAGGDSSEWVVSIKSAQGILNFLKDQPYHTYLITIKGTDWEYKTAAGETLVVDKNDFSITESGMKICFDFAYITIHGTPGENGILQGYFELLRIPYSCCGVMAASITFNKYMCNKLLQNFGLPIAEAIVLHPHTPYQAEAIVAQLGLPCFVKPNVGGSSFGTTKVKAIEALQPAIKEAFAEGPEVIIESFMQGTEITCGCYRVGEQMTVFPITEVVSKNEFFDYEAKYNADQVDEITPARISDTLTKQVQEQTARIYDLLGCKGIIRVDYIIVDGVPHLLEVNTTPGMTATSFIPQQVRAAGLEIGQVLAEIIDSEIAKNEAKNS